MGDGEEKALTGPPSQCTFLRKWSEGVVREKWSTIFSAHLTSAPEPRVYAGQPKAMWLPRGGRLLT